MRFLIAATLFIVSVSFLLLGLAQRTIWAPPSVFAVNLVGQESHPYLIIPADALAMMPGEVTIRASGSGQVFLAAGKEVDVLAWVAKTSHSTVESSAEDQTLKVIKNPGTEDFISPVGSDLWISEFSAESIAQLVLPEGQGLAVLVASDGLTPAPERVRVSWPIENSTTVSDIFLSVGLGLLIIAIFFNVLALGKMIRNRGPRRKLPKAPQGPRYKPKNKGYDLPRRGRRSASNKIALVPISVGLVLALSGCQIAEVPQSSPTPSKSPTVSVVDEIQPALNQEQVTRILTDIQRVVAEADTSGETSLLQTRVEGPALLFREVNYLLRSKSPEVLPLAPISTEVVSITMISKTKEWPRSLIVVTSDGDKLPQTLVIQQLSPREPYKLLYNMALLPGVKFPDVAAASKGAIPVEVDSLFLKSSPISLAPTYGDLIDNGPASEFFSLFDLSTDKFYEQIAQTQKNQTQSLDEATTVFSHELGDASVISLTTSDSGAIVALMMVDTWEIRPTSRNSAVTVSGDELLLLGVEGSRSGVNTRYGNMLLFYVPLASSDQKIRLLGATQSLLSIEVL
jgi:hypothetical protein